MTNDPVLFDRMLVLGHYGRLKHGQARSTFDTDHLSLGLKYRPHLYAILLALGSLSRLDGAEPAAPAQLRHPVRGAGGLSRPSSRSPTHRRRDARRFPGVHPAIRTRARGRLEPPTRSCTRRGRRACPSTSSATRASAIAGGCCTRRRSSRTLDSRPARRLSRRRDAPGTRPAGRDLPVVRGLADQPVHAAGVHRRAGAIRTRVRGGAAQGGACAAAMGGRSTPASHRDLRMENERRWSARCPISGQVRAFLRAACDGPVALDALEATYFQAGAGGPVARPVRRSGTANGEVLRLAARRVDAAKGPRIEAAINARSPRPRPATGFAQAALYAPDLDLLFQVFPIDDRLPSLPDRRRWIGDGRRPADGARRAGRAPRAWNRSPSTSCATSPNGSACALRPHVGAGEGERLPRVVWARVARRSKFARTSDILPRLRRGGRRSSGSSCRAAGRGPRPGHGALRPRFPAPSLFALVQRDDFPELCREAGAGAPALPCTAGAGRGGLRRGKRQWSAWPRTRPNSPGCCLPDAKTDRRARSASRRSPACRTRSPPRLIHRDFHGDNSSSPADASRSSTSRTARWANPPTTSARTGRSSPGTCTGPGRGRPHRLRAARRSSRAISTRPTRRRTLHLPAYAAMHCFLYAHQCLRHPQDPGRHEDARVMLAACEDVLDRGLR